MSSGREACVPRHQGMAAVGTDRHIRADRQITILGFRGDPGKDRPWRASPHHTWDTGRCIGSPIHPTNPYRRDRCGVYETTASVSSSFRRGREGMGDFGIAFVPGRDRFGKLGR